MPNERIFLLTDDESLLARLKGIAQDRTAHSLQGFPALTSLPEKAVALIDLDTTGFPTVSSRLWREPCARLRLGFLSGRPNDEEGIALLEAGACGYAHSYAAESSLRQMIDVISSGELWVGRSLMARLLGNLRRATHSETGGWEVRLTEREREVARMAAMGQPNLQIGQALGITERTVKAHLTAIFEKLGVSDRLQLALKIHGIQ